MELCWMHALIPLWVFGINVVSQIFAARALSKKPMFVTVIIGFGVGFLSLVSAEALIFLTGTGAYVGHTGSFVVNLITYVGLSYSYFHVVNLTETSRRIRVLRELMEAPQGLTRQEIAALYGFDEIVERRLNRFLQARQIAEKDGCYRVVSPLLLSAARLLTVLKIIFLGVRSEFEKPS